MSKIHDFSGGMFCHSQLNASTYVKLLSSLILQEMKEDNISQLGDYDAPFCEQQYTHGSYCISLFKLKSFDQLIPPKLPQILDIYSNVAPLGVLCNSIQGLGCTREESILLIWKASELCSSLAQMYFGKRRANQINLFWSP